MKNSERQRLRKAKVLSRIDWFRRNMAERLNMTRKLFGKRVYSVDIHSHSSFSDGIGTIMDNHERAVIAGLDFMFATDHRRIGQRRIVRRWEDASWGQEPVIGPHHIGLLCNSRVFRPDPKAALSVNLENARKIAPFAWIPHPVGWYPKTWYTDEGVDQLWQAGEAFAMEIINGALKITRAYDQFDAKAVGVWDRLLCDGRRVTAVAGSDAHCPEEVGSVWCGVFASTCSAKTIIAALNAGHCFASEAALMDFSCDNKPMGATIRKRSGTAMKIRFRVADSAGLARIAIVSQGKIIHEILPCGEALVEGAISVKAGRKPAYFRLESVSVDDNRAFSTPIYTEVL